MPKNTRKSIKLEDAHKLFIHAECFRVTAELLWNEWKNGKTCYAYPFIANDAFCCELFLKCLSAVRSEEHPTGHRLDDLYNALSIQDRESVERHYESLSAGDPAHEQAGKNSPSKSNALRDFLADGSDVFELIRYWYERPFPSRRGNFHYPILAIREAILEISPDWRMPSDKWTVPNNPNSPEPTTTYFARSISDVFSQIHPQVNETVSDGSTNCEDSDHLRPLKRGIASHPSLTSPPTSDVTS